jgi:hypothetical protein
MTAPDRVFVAIPLRTGRTRALSAARFNVAPASGVPRPDSVVSIETRRET